MTRHDLIGYANPDGSGRGNWTRRRPPESTVLWRNGRRAKCKWCDQPPHGGHIRQYQATPSPDGPSLLEIVLGVAVLLVWFVAIFWALPVLATAMMR